MDDRSQPSRSPNLDKLPAVSSYTWDSIAVCATLSAGAQLLLGVPSPISTDDFFEYIHPDDRVRFQAETVAHMETGGDSTQEFRFIRRDGKLRHVIAHSTLESSDSTGHSWIEGIFIDVTAARSRKPGKAPAERLMGSYDFDCGSETSVWSQALRETFKSPSPDPITSAAILRQIHPDDRDRVAAQVQMMLHKPGPYEMTFRLLLPGGRIVRVRDKGASHPPLDPVTGKVSRASGTLTDITRLQDRTEALKLDNDAFWRLVDTAPIGVYAVDADMRMVRISQNGMAAFSGIERLLGRKIDEILRILWPEPFASQAIAQFHHTLTTGEPHHADPVVEDRADRKVLEAYDWSVERIVMEDGSHGVLCYFYDLSERVRNERAQKEQQHRLSIAYNAAGMGAWDFDVTSGQVHGTPQLAALFGVPGFTGDFAGIWQRVVHPDDKDAVDAAFDLSLRNGAPYDVDYRIVTKDGAIRYLAAQGEVVRDGKGQPARIIGVNYDITDRKQTEIALRQSEGRIRMVIDSTLAFVGVLDPDGTLREVNRPALHFGGLTRADVIGMPFWETPWWMHSPAVSQICRTAVEAGRTGHTNRCDVIIRGKDDRLITIDFLLSPVFDVQGNVEMLVASGFDISAREEARARAQALMGEINHRTKNILTLVQVLARMTARGGSADFITRFEERVHALALAQDLLFASAADTVDLGALAKSQLGHFRDLMGDRICLSGPKLDLAPHAAQAIGMALHELATNAGKYGALSSAQGRIDVVWDVQTDGKFKICWIEQGGPPVVPPKARGFGSTVVEEMTRNTLDAKVHLDYAPGGVKWHLTCGVKALTSPR